MHDVAIGVVRLGALIQLGPRVCLGRDHHNAAVGAVGHSGLIPIRRRLDGGGLDLRGGLGLSRCGRLGVGKMARRWLGNGRLLWLGRCNR